MRFVLRSIVFLAKYKNHTVNLDSNIRKDEPYFDTVSNLYYSQHTVTRIPNQDWTIE